MGTRTMIWLACGIPAVAAVWSGNLTLAAVFFMAAPILQMLHHLEVKINRLLDDRGIRVSDEELRD